SATHRDPPSFPTRRSSDLPETERIVAIAVGVRFHTQVRQAYLDARHRLSDLIGNHALQKRRNRPYLERKAAQLAAVIQHVHIHRSEEHTSELQSRENLVCR